MIYTIWTTTDCNLRCEYCYEEKKCKKSMSMDMANKVVKYIIENEEKSKQELLISFHGGEPFLNLSIVRYIVSALKSHFEKKVSFIATTNGTVLNDKDIEFVGKNINELSVSLDGDAETHDLRRKDILGRGSHQKTLNCALKLLKYNPELRIRMTYDHTNVAKLYHNVSFLAGQGFKCIVAGENFYDCNWDDEKINILKCQIRKIKEKFDDKTVLINLCDPIKLYCMGECHGGESSLHIFPDGKFYPCVLAGGVSDFEIGDIKNGIDSDRVKEILSHSDEKDIECKECALSTGCENSRCMIINKIVMGKWNSAIPIRCQVNRLMYEINGIE